MLCTAAASSSASAAATTLALAIPTVASTPAIIPAIPDAPTFTTPALAFTSGALTASVVAAAATSATPIPCDPASRATPRLPSCTPATVAALTRKPSQHPAARYATLLPTALVAASSMCPTPRRSNAFMSTTSVAAATSSTAVHAATFPAAFPTASDAAAFPTAIPTTCVTTVATASVASVATASSASIVAALFPSTDLPAFQSTALPAFFTVASPFVAVVHRAAHCPTDAPTRATFPASATVASLAVAAFGASNSAVSARGRQQPDAVAVAHAHSATTTHRAILCPSLLAAALAAFEAADTAAAAISPGLHSTSPARCTINPTPSPTNSST